MSLLRKIPTILGAGGGNVPEWRRHLQPCEWLETDGNSYIRIPNIGNYNVDNLLFNSKIEYPIGKVSAAFGWRYQSSNGFYICERTDTSDKITFGFRSTLQNINNAGHEFIFKNDKKHWIVTDFEGNLIFDYTYSQGNWSSSTFLLFAAMQTSNSQLIKSPNGTKFYNTTEIDFGNGKNFNLQTCYVIDEYIDNKGTLCGSGVAGMVDTLTGIFYTNDDTGAFTYGADINI